VSENITVRSIVDRFLEHSRVFYFENACQPESLLSSADWMPRNFFRRIEIAFPIEDGVLRDRLASEILALSLVDNERARLLNPDGSYRRAAQAPGEKPRRSQFEFVSLAQSDGRDQPRRSQAKSKYPRVQLAPRPSGRAKRRSSP
jgi:polyphosphate kinase